MIYTKYILFSLLLVCPSVLSAQGITRRIHQIDEVTVWGKRPMKEIGVQKTKFDSLALKENIALSMADILTFNSSVFVKSYGRATLSTVAFRGTSPSHTQVTWNGMRINNPMLGMTDFSTIPSYFIDQASLLHGTSSVNETGGGLGGLVKLGTTPQVGEGFHAQYVQGIGSFRTFDEFARFTYGSDRWQVSTRAVYSSSPNDYKYTNHDKKINIYDEEKNIIGQYHPKERNRSGSFKDLHLLQEVYYNTLKGDRFGLNAWYINSNRELPMLTTDYGDETAFENRQREQTFRGVLSWDHIDQASLLHGTSSVNETGGGLGGLVKLGTTPQVGEGFHAQYVQGIGSFRTFDEFARFTYGSDRWQVSTRAVYSSSPNDYKYTNHDKKINIYDEEKNIIGQYHPKERNRSGSFKDLHLLQEVYYNTLKGDRFGLNAWYINSNRELPMLTTDYGDETAFENRQREQTFRGVLSWDHIKEKWKVGVKGGYIHTWMAYDYRREVAPDNWASMTRSRSKINTFYGQAEAEYSPGRKWFFTSNVSVYQHLVRSEDKNIILQDGNKAVVGYDKGRVELSGSVSAKWQPVEPLGLSLVLREEMSGDKWAPLIPAFFIDGLISRKGNVMVKASVSRNYRFPTLNDLYFLPGGNPDLKNEHGFSYDAGVSFDVGKKGVYKLGGSASWFDSYIDDWIIWLPTTKGFFSPRNVKKVHAYGVEVKANLAVQPAKDWLIDLNGSYSWTPSINEGEKMSPADQSVGKQLPYVPEHSASLTGRLSWRTWAFLYKWAYYSERFTMSSNDYTLTGHLPRYFMSNISLEKMLSFKPLDVQLKLAVNNLFNEDYLSVLSRPMPGINFEFFIGITPKFGKSRK